MQRSPLRLAAMMLACAVVSVVLPSVARAATLVVDSTSPASNATAPRTTTISVTFDRAVTLGAFDGSTFRVFGRGTGTASGSFALSNANKTVTFTPTAPFSAGEVVSVNLSHDLVAADTSPLRSAGYAFQFTVAVQPGARTFAYRGAMSNQTGGQRTAYPDLRRAGDRPQSRWLPRSRDRQRGERRRARHPERRRRHGELRSVPDAEADRVTSRARTSRPTSTTTARPTAASRRPPARA